MARPRVMLGADSLRRSASGIGRVARLMARVLAEEAQAGRIDAEAVVLSDPEAPDDLGIPVRTVRGSRLRFVAAMHHAALSHSHFIYDFPGIARAHPRLALLRRPYMVWIHGIEIWEDARADRLRLAQRADMLLVNTRYTHERAMALHAGLSDAQVCWPATEEDVAPQVADFARPPTALILARIDERGGYKGHHELIACWPAVIAAVPDARLIIGGDGPGVPLVRSWVENSSARLHIELLGFVPNAGLDALWARASLFCMPSRGEGFGLAYVEAMRHGVPVVASVHDAAAEVNLDGITGYNVNLDHPSELTDRLVLMLQNRVETARLGAAARSRWQEHFRFAAFRTRFRPVLYRFLADQSP